MHNNYYTIILNSFAHNIFDKIFKDEIPINNILEKLLNTSKFLNKFN